MSDSHVAPGGHNYETQIDDVAGAVHTGRGDIIHIERVEFAAARAAEALRHALSDDEETRQLLLDILRHLSTLQAQLEEWKELHHLLHELLAAFSPFYASLRTFSYAQIEPKNGRTLLRGWRPCQTEVDRLMDFETRVEYIHLSRDREEIRVSRPDWGARIASLRREVEDRLREERWNAEGLIDLADEFNQACDCYLSLADRELRRVIGKVQRLYTRLLGGIL